MKFLLSLTLFFYFGTLPANDLTVEVNAGYCTSAQSGQAIVLVTGGTEPYTFQWSDPSLEGNEAYDLDSGIYLLTVTDATSCEIIKSFEITENSVYQVSFQSIDVLCNGEANGQILITDFVPSNLQFSIDGINFSDQTSFENLSAGTYDIYILEGNNCMTQREILVEDPLPLIVDLGQDLSIQFGDEIALDPIVFGPNLIQNFNWSPQALFECNYCLDQLIRPSETTTVVFTVQDQNGCIASDTITIEVSENKGVFIPNIFTPDGNGFNDIFTVFSGYNVNRIKKMIIRDNFGDIVYENFNLSPVETSIGWDGNYLGKKMQPGVFIYQVQVEYFDGSIEDIFGTVTLMR